MADKTDSERVVSYAPGNSYIVVHVPSEDDYNKKSFYLRTGDSIESVVASAREEFTGEDVELEYNTGTFEVDGDVLRVTPELAPHLTYLVGEALFYQGFVDSDDSVSGVVTFREPTRCVYRSNTGFVTAVDEYDKSLVELLTDPEEPCLIRIPGVEPFRDVMHEIDYARLAGGVLCRRLVAMNYGYIYSKRSTFVLDGDYGSDDACWYVLPNSDETLWHIQSLFNEDGAVGVLSASSEFTFSEADKVGSHRRFLFDGSIRDLVDVLVEQGIELDASLSLGCFSDD